MKRDALGAYIGFATAFMPGGAREARSSKVVTPQEFWVNSSDDLVHHIQQAYVDVDAIGGPGMIALTAPLLQTCLPPQIE